MKMNKPIINDSLSVDEIHKIREYHYEITKNMSNKEVADEINKEASKFKKKLKARNKRKAAV